MSGLPGVRTRIVTDGGVVLHEETTRHEIEGAQIYEVTEIQVGLCPSCGSRLDQAKLVGVCWECNVPVCSHCAGRCRCGRTLCDRHKHLSTFAGNLVEVCAECLPKLELRQRIEDQLRLREETRRERREKLDARVRLSELQLREKTAAHQIDISTREQRRREAVSRVQAQIAVERLRLQKLHTYAPTAYALLHGERSTGSQRTRR